MTNIDTRPGRAPMTLEYVLRLLSYIAIIVIAVCIFGWVAFEW